MKSTGPPCHSLWLLSCTCVSGEASLKISIIMIRSQFYMTPSPHPPFSFYVLTSFLHCLVSCLFPEIISGHPKSWLLEHLLVCGTVYLVCPWYSDHQHPESLPSNMFVLPLGNQFLEDLKMLGGCRLVILSISVIFHFVFLQLVLRLKRNIEK